MLERQIGISQNQTNNPENTTNAELNEFPKIFCNQTCKSAVSFDCVHYDLLGSCKQLIDDNVQLLSTVVVFFKVAQETKIPTKRKIGNFSSKRLNVELVLLH